MQISLQEHIHTQTDAHTHTHTYYEQDLRRVGLDTTHTNNIAQHDIKHLTVCHIFIEVLREM